MKFSEILFWCASVGIVLFLITAARVSWEALARLKLGFDKNKSVNPLFYVQATAIALLYIAATVSKYFGY